MSGASDLLLTAVAVELDVRPVPDHHCSDAEIAAAGESAPTNISKRIDEALAQKAERAAANRAAWSASGISSVVNQLRLV